jgi:AraC-like DNA-binding protein
MRNLKIPAQSAKKQRQIPQIILAKSPSIIVLGNITARERASAEQGVERFAHVISHIESNLSEPDKLTIDVLSAIAELSPSRFKALFKEKLGIPPAEYALRLRIKEARRRLTAGDATVTGVALDLGFSSSQYFASSFKRLTLMTPREAMKKSRQRQQRFL